MEFKSPKYYKELRKLRNNLDQVTETRRKKRNVHLVQASSLKHQAPETSSDKLQASSDKLQARASSHKPQAP
jgi:hypothetical protein